MQIKMKKNMSTSNILVSSCSYLSPNQIKQSEDISWSVKTLISRNSKKKISYRDAAAKHLQTFPPSSTSWFETARHLGHVEALIQTMAWDWSSKINNGMMLKLWYRQRHEAEALIQITAWDWSSDTDNGMMLKLWFR